MSGSVQTEVSQAPTDLGSCVGLIPDLPSLSQVPDQLGRFGAFGGRFVPETLMDALNLLRRGVREGQGRPRVPGRLNDYLKDYVGRPSPLFLAERLTRFAAGPTST